MVPTRVDAELKVSTQNCADVNLASEAANGILAEKIPFAASNKVVFVTDDLITRDDYQAEEYSVKRAEIIGSDGTPELASSVESAPWGNLQTVESDSAMSAEVCKVVEDSGEGRPETPGVGGSDTEEQDLAENLLDEEIPKLTEFSDSESDADDADVITVQRVQKVTLKIPLTVAGKELHAVVDTGAEVSVMSEKFYRALPNDCRPTLQPATVKLVVADKRVRLKDNGVMTVRIQLGNRTFNWPVYVAPIADDFLLGSDILDYYDLTLNTRKGVLVDGEWVISKDADKPKVIRKLTLSEDVLIPARHEVIFPVALPDSVTQHLPTAIFDPVAHDERQILIARTVLDLSHPNIPVRCVNVSEEPVKLKKGYLLGNLQTLDPKDIISTLDAEESPTVGVRKVEAGKTDSGRANHDVVREGETSATGTDSGLIPEHLKTLYEETSKDIESAEQRRKLADILVRYQKAFAASKTDVGTLKIADIKHKIDTGCAAPIRQPLRRTPRGFEGEEEKNLKAQLDAGVVRPSSSPWASPVVLCRKSDSTVRWCLDYRRLNDCTKKDAYPLARIDMCLDSLGGVQYFSTLDLQSGYWQIPMEESDIPKTAFITKYGLYEYTKMPFGLSNAPATFQRCMELVFRGLQWKTLLIYLDDVIILSKDIDEGLDRLEEALARLENAGLKLKPSKCKLLQSEVLYLGHVISRDGLKPNPKLIESVKNAEPPRNQKEVQQFHGLCNYYRKFIEHYSDLAYPLTQLTGKNVPFEWSAEAQRSFDALKTALCTAPVLSYPREVGLLILDTDASDVGIGSVLSQIQDGEEKPLAYGSKKLSKQQARYCVTRRELLAIVVFLAEFRHWLLGGKFLIRTDHSSLRWLMNFKEPQGQLARWLEYIQEYDFDIVHRAGKKHQNADALSRMSENSDCAAYTQRVKLADLPCGGCKTCQKRQDEWATFDEEVDDIVPLTNKCRQVTTRRQKMKAQKLSADKANGPADQASQAATKNSNIADKNTSAEDKQSGTPKTKQTVKSKEKGADKAQNPETQSAGREERAQRPQVTRANPADNRQQADGLIPPSADNQQGSASHPNVDNSWVDGYTQEALQLLQREDSDLKPIFEWLAQGSKPDRDVAASYSPATRSYWLNFEQIEQVAGVLYYKWLDPDAKKPPHYRLLVPKKTRQEVLNLCHNNILGAHLGINKTVDRMKQRYHWYKMGEEVKVHIRTCRQCCQNRQPYRKFKAALASFRVGYPLDRVGIDILGPLPTSGRGNKYILVIADYFTRWVEAYALPEQTAETVAHTIVHEFVCRFGTPLEIHSDQGRNFESALFREVCRLLEITKTRSSPYHPQSNGLVERFNRTLASMIRCQIENNLTDWDLHIPLLTAAYRSTVHPATGFSPNFLMFGRELNLPTDLVFPRPRQEVPQDLPEYVVALQERLHSCFELARQTLKESAERQKRVHDTRVIQQQYEPGSLVYKRHHNRKKLETPWVGPYVIKKSIGDCLYQIADKKKTYVLHHDLLKPYTCSQVPKWVEQAKSATDSL